MSVSYPPPQRRRLSHTRSITIEAFERDDGLWDLEAKLTDIKTHDFPLASGVRLAGQPVHDIRLTLTIDRLMTVTDVQATSARVPYPNHCDVFSDAYRSLIGLSLLKNFRMHVREKLGGVQGCTHMSDLAVLLPTAAIQAFAGTVVQTQDNARAPAVPPAGAMAEDAAINKRPEKRPMQIDGCRALRADGVAVAQFYPRWSTVADTSAMKADAPTAQPVQDAS